MRLRAGRRACPGVCCAWVCASGYVVTGARMVSTCALLCLVCAVSPIGRAVDSVEQQGQHATSALDKNTHYAQVSILGAVCISVYAHVCVKMQAHAYLVCDGRHVYVCVRACHPSPIGFVYFESSSHSIILGT